MRRVMFRPAARSPNGREDSGAVRVRLPPRAPPRIWGPSRRWRGRARRGQERPLVVAGPAPDRAAPVGRRCRADLVGRHDPAEEDRGSVAAKDVRGEPDRQAGRWRPVESVEDRKDCQPPRGVDESETAVMSDRPRRRSTSSREMPGLSNRSESHPEAVVPTRSNRPIMARSAPRGLRGSWSTQAGIRCVPTSPFVLAPADEG